MSCRPVIANARDVPSEKTEPPMVLLALAAVAEGLVKAVEPWQVHRLAGQLSKVWR